MWRSFACVVVLLVACSASAHKEQSLDALVNERLGLMRDVAAYKWHRQLDIEDRQREAEVLRRSVQEALTLGVTPVSAEGFFRAQIEAAKAVQSHWFARWAAGEPSAPKDAVPDLVSETRPRLMDLGARILAAAASGYGGASLTLTVEGVDGQTAARLQEAARGLRLFAHRLEQIRATGELRVGTTGDYAPFTHRGSAAEPFAGIDVEMAMDLADALGVRPVFVPTSWPTLMEDLSAGRFDIAMGGVSITAERRRVGYFSIPYYSGGKTPIALCAQAARFGTLAEIDSPGVRVIVNPGGTNERFVRASLRRAEVVMHPDNRTIFEEILAGRADVMITDRIEVALQSSRQPRLCGTMDRTLNHQDKAYLLPTDNPWKRYVDDWLYQRLRIGMVNALFRAHGVRLAH
ncbi:MAG: chorismate mutase AroQ, gamma subclass [Gammaproteobacteria bacterium]|nr:chorismate mutase AroQ, gamma subclass [Gammaproteobacteria bacterium]